MAGTLKAPPEGYQTLSEHESKLFLKGFGIPVTREREVATEAELGPALREIGFPVVLKASDPNLAHKSELGLVHLDLRYEAEALDAFRLLREALRGSGGAVLVQEMIRGRREFVAGLTRDVQFGPCVMFGLGGILAEALGEVVFRVAPFGAVEAREMLKEGKARALLQAVRGMPAADLAAMADILVSLARIGMEEPQVREIDINPIILNGPRPVAVDALVVLEP